MESISTSEVNLFLERKEGFKLDCSVKFPTEGITVVLESRVPVRQHF